MTGHIKTWCKNADLLVCRLVRSLFNLLSDPIVFLWEWLIAPSLLLALWFARLWTPHILSTQSGRTSSRATCTTTLTWSWQRRAFTGKANSCFMYLGDCVSNGFCSKTRHLFNYRLRNYCMIQFSYFVYFYSGTGIGSGISRATEYFISIDEDANERELLLTLSG